MTNIYSSGMILNDPDKIIVSKNNIVYHFKENTEKKSHKISEVKVLGKLIKKSKDNKYLQVEYISASKSEIIRLKLWNKYEREPFKKIYENINLPNIDTYKIEIKKNKYVLEDIVGGTKVLYGTIIAQSIDGKKTYYEPFKKEIPEFDGKIVTPRNIIDSYPI